MGDKEVKGMTRTITSVMFLGSLLLPILIPTTGINLESSVQQSRKSASDLGGEVSEGFQLSARLENTIVNLGEPIFLSLSIRNVTTDLLFLVDTYPEKDY